MDDQYHLTMDHVRLALMKSPEGVDVQDLVNLLGGYINPEKNVGRVIGAMLGKLSHYDEASRDDAADKWYATDKIVLDDPQFSLPEFKKRSPKRDVAPAESAPAPEPEPEQARPVQQQAEPTLPAHIRETNEHHVAITLLKEQHHVKATIELLIDGIWQQPILMYDTKMIISANLPNYQPRYPIENVQTVRIHSWDELGNETIHDEEIPRGYYVTFLSADAW